MQEIKFRAWDKEKKVMIPAIHIFINWMWVVWENMRDGLEWNDDLRSTKRYELMQYVWLKDKNGKEIYEGDYTDSGNMICFIDWMFIPYYDWGNQERYEDVWCDWWSECEIIGNQYENPNLPEEYDR